jgi:hypothetical protein
MKPTSNGTNPDKNYITDQNKTVERLRTKTNFEPLLNQLLQHCQKAQYLKK